MILFSLESVCFVYYSLKLYITPIVSFCIYRPAGLSEKFRSRFPFTHFFPLYSFLFSPLPNPAPIYPSLSRELFLPKVSHLSKTTGVSCLLDHSC